MAQHETLPAISLLKSLSMSWAHLRDNWFSLLLTVFLRELISLIVACIAYAIFVDWREGNFRIAFLAKTITWNCLYLDGWKNILAMFKERKYAALLIGGACLFFTSLIGFLGLIMFFSEFSFYGMLFESFSLISLSFFYAQISERAKEQ